MGNKKRTAFAILWILIGATYLAYSGRAEGFVSIRSVLIFFVIALVGTAFWDLITIVKALYKKDYARSKTESKFFVAKLIAISLIVAGHRIDNQKISETINTGDALVAAIEQYKSKEGHYPASLEALDFRNYQPALKDSTFWISSDNQNEFSISFESVAFLICTRKNTNPDWHCDD